MSDDVTKNTTEYQISLGVIDEDDGVYCARPSPLGNPFRGVELGSKEEAVEKYREWLPEELKKCGPAWNLLNTILRKLKVEKKITLLCYCRTLPCHTEVIRDELLRLLANSPDR